MGPHPSKTAKELLDQYYLEIRCHLLEAAAGFDRLERYNANERKANPQAQDLNEDRRLQRLQQALQILATPGTDRATRFLNLFSDE